MTTHWFWLLCLGCIVWTTNSIASTRLVIYSYHSAPPFVLNADKETGLNYDLMRALSAQLSDRYQLDYQPITRSELNQRLATGQAAIVLWANPAWFKAAKKPYHWTQPIVSDREIFVSPITFQRTIKQLTDLAGSQLGTLEGYKYPGVDELIATGQLSRVDAKTDKENLTRLADGSVDHLVITRSSFLYYGRQAQFLGKMKISGQPYPSYQRHLLLTHHYSNQLSDIEQALSVLNQQTQWQARLDLYGLKK